jgi:hypothetical protein
MSNKYQRVFEEENRWSNWIQPIPQGYKMSCCDCGLVHELNFRIYKGRIQFQAKRNNRSTGQVRRHRKDG